MSDGVGWMKYHRSGLYKGLLMVNGWMECTVLRISIDHKSCFQLLYRISAE